MSSQNLVFLEKKTLYRINQLYVDPTIIGLHIFNNQTISKL